MSHLRTNPPKGERRRGRDLAGAEPLSVQMRANHTPESTAHLCSHQQHIRVPASGIFRNTKRHHLGEKNPSHLVQPQGARYHVLISRFFSNM